MGTITNSDHQLWAPKEEEAMSSPMAEFFRDLGMEQQLIAGYHALHRWSVEELESFWQAAWQDAAVSCQGNYQEVLTSHDMPPLANGEIWFPGVRFNFSQHMLRWNDNHLALLCVDEQGNRQQLSYRQLLNQTARCQRGLMALGVGVGDRVAGWLPNIAETVVAMLATTSLGAIWSSASPDFGHQAVIDRFGQIEPKVLFFANGYRYGGKQLDCLTRINQLTQALPSKPKLVMVPFLNNAPSVPINAMLWETFLGKDDDPVPQFASLPFDHPLCILFSSGTTGKPKCIVHRAGGVLLKHHVELRLHCSLNRKDVLLYFTTCGWMMWNWLISGLAQGCTVMLYEGSPAFPQPQALWEVVKKHHVTIFGASPKYFALCQKANIKYGDAQLPQLRSVLSTGSTLTEHQFYWAYQAIKSNMQLASISGGTDLIGCFMLGNPLSAVYPGQIQGHALGMDIAAFNDQGQPVINQKGELVCRQPFPSMPLGFWHDDSRQAYQATYFQYYSHTWRHGDFITITPQKGILVHGRSDATLNPGGIRIGPAEIYNVVEALPFIQDSLVVPWSENQEESIRLLVVLTPNLQLNDTLKETIRETIRRQTSPRHVPKWINQVAEVPITYSGKKVELAAAAVLRGEAIKNQEAVANSQALRALAKLKI